MRLHSFYSLLLPCITILALATQCQAIYRQYFKGAAIKSPFPGIDRVFGSHALEFWEEAKSRGDEFKTMIEKKFQNEAEKLPQAAATLDELKVLMTQLVDASNQFRDDIQRTIHNNIDIDLADISEKLSNEFDVVLEDFKEEFTLPLSDDQDARHAERKKMLSWLMRKIEDVLVKVLALNNVPEAVVRARFREIEPKITNVILVITKLVDKHPILFDMLIYTTLAWILPEYWLLKPLLRLFGFGPSGPLKGSAAAWAQSRFFGANVVKGSWFAYVQSKAMKDVGKSAVGVMGVGNSRVHPCLL